MTTPLPHPATPPSVGDAPAAPPGGAVGADGGWHTGPAPAPAARGPAFSGPAVAGPGPYDYAYAEPDRVVAFFAGLAQRTPRWIGPAALAGCCAAASAYVLWTNPTDGGAGELPGCLVKLTTGFDCPGCGGTRAFWFLLHGDLGAAAQHHLLFVFAAPFLVYSYIAWVAGVAFHRRLPQLRLSFRSVGIALAVWAVFTVLRNVPFEPFTWFYV